MEPGVRFEIGDIVRVTSAELEGETGIVCKPNTKTRAGHVLVCSGG